MLSRNLYKVKKAPLNEKRKKTFIALVIVFSLFSIAYGVYSFRKIKPEDGQKTEVKLETGDRPLKKNQIIYINSEKGLNLRKERDPKSGKLALIPNKTKLEATEELDGWYKVTYNGLTGWIAKEFTTESEPEKDAFADWSLFTGAGYKVKYPLGWKVKDYGKKDDMEAESFVAFSNQELPASLSGNDFVAPVYIKVSTISFSDMEKNLSAISGVKKQNISVSTSSGVRFTYMSSFSNTEMNTVLINMNGKAVIVSEGGGYEQDMLDMLKTFSL